MPSTGLVHRYESLSARDQDVPTNLLGNVTDDPNKRQGNL